MIIFLNLFITSLILLHLKNCAILWNFYIQKYVIYKILNCKEIHWCKSENENSKLFKSNNETELTDTLVNYLDISFDEDELNISCNNSIVVTLKKEDNEKNGSQIYNGKGS